MARFQKQHSPWNKGLGKFISCQVCRTSQWVQNWKLKAGKGKFCSKKCAYEGRVCKGLYEKGHAKSFLGPRVHTQETKDKISVSSIGKHTGEKAWNWIKDRTMVKGYASERNNSAYKAWRIAVFRRDNFRCVWCGSNQAIKADHVLQWSKYIDKRYDVENGQTLCDFCHKAKTKMELSKESNKLIFIY